MAPHPACRLAKLRLSRGSARSAVAAAPANIEHVVRHLEPAVLEQCRHLTVDETFELTAGIEVGDDAAFGAHQMMVMVLRIRLGEFMAIAATCPRHPRHHADVDEFSELPVHGGGGHTRLAHHFIGRERTVGGFDGRNHRGTVRCETQPASRQHLADSG